MAENVREHLRGRAREGGIPWTQMGLLWPELDACYCQGTQPDGTPCSELRLQQLEALFARDDAANAAREAAQGEGHGDG